MKVIKQRETLQSSISLMALMAAINVIVAEIAGLSPVVSLFLILFLPLTSTLVELSCKDRYFPIYAFATVGLSIALTFWNIETTIFYVLPSVIAGYIFGLMAKKKIPAIWSIFAATLAQMAISFALIPFINFVFQVDIVFAFEKAFGVDQMAGIWIIVPSFIFAISSLQTVLSYLVIANELSKFGIKPINNPLFEKIPHLVGLIFSLLVWCFYFIRLDLAYISLCISIYFTCYSFGIFIQKKNYTCIILCGACIFLNIFFYAMIQSYLVNYSQLLLISFSTTCICLISCVVSFLIKKKD